MRQTYSIVLFFIILLIGCGANSAFAEEGSHAAATVIAIRGDVKAISAEGEERTLIMKSPIYTQDTIRTGKRGRIQIFFTDNSIISLGRNSEMKIAEYKWQADENRGALKTEVKEGVFRVMGGAITKASPEKFITETPTATIGIRGSMYAGRVSAGSLSVVFQGGKGILVFNAQGSVSISKPGYGTRVRLNNRPKRPFKFRDRDIVSFSRALAGNGEPVDEPQILEGERKEDGTLPLKEQPEDEGLGGVTQPPPDGQTGDTDPAKDPVPGGSQTDGPISGNAPESTDGQSTSGDGQVTDEPMYDPMLAASEDHILVGDNLLMTDPLFQDTASSPPPVPPPNEFAPLVDTTSPPKPPLDGNTIYHGTLAGSAIFNSGNQEGINDIFWMEVNWHNHKVLGKIASKFNNTPKFFFGDIVGTTATNFQFFGSDAGDPVLSSIIAIEGSGSGYFSGANCEVFNGLASGELFKMEPSTQDLEGSWNFKAGGYKNPDLFLRSPRGTASDPDWEGYVVAAGEDMADPVNNRQLVMTTASGNFTLNLDKNSGTILSGQMNSLTGLGQIDSLNIGGSNPSVFVSDHSMASVLSLASGTGLKSHGNFMVTAAPEKQSARYATWGYWEIAYIDTYQYHAHVPATMWVAGEPTITLPTDFKGTYLGRAFASKIATGQPFKNLEGNLKLDVDFSTSAVTGSIKFFNEIDLNVAASVVSGEITGGISTATLPNGSTIVPSSSNINGTFFGPNAESVAGNFRSDFSSTTYMGIYAGDR